jgi:hypothetical protein
MQYNYVSLNVAKAKKGILIMIALSSIILNFILVIYILKQKSDKKNHQSFPYASISRESSDVINNVIKFMLKNEIYSLKLSPLVPGFKASSTTKEVDYFSGIVDYDIILDQFKKIATLNTCDKNPQTGTFVHNIKGQNVNIEINTVSQGYFETITVNIK